MIYIEQPERVKCGICGKDFYIDAVQYIIGARYICKECISKGIFKAGYWYINNDEPEKCEEEGKPVQTALF